MQKKIKFTGWALLLIGAFLIPTGVFNLRGWWLLQTPDLKALVVMGALLIVPFVYSLLKRKEVKAMTDKQKNIYVCPMHPDVRQEGPGRCSVCQMELVAEKEEEKE